MTDYSSILNALSQSNPQQGEIARRAENYRAADELAKQGVSVNDLMKRLDDLESKVKGMERPADTIDRNVFNAMVAATKDDPAVLAARQHLADVKAQIVTEHLMKDPRYKEAYDAYRSKVSERYVASHSEEPSRPGEGPAGICHDPERGVPPQEGVQSQQADEQARRDAPVKRLFHTFYNIALSSAAHPADTRGDGR